MSSHSDEKSLLVPLRTPLFGIPTQVDGQWMIRYVAGDPSSGDPVEEKKTLEAALAVIGAWSDLDWESFADDLESIRHGDRAQPI